MKLHHSLTLAAAFALPLSLSAATISGTVIDKTTNKPAAGDTAVLLALTQGMQETAHTTVDAQGHFSFNVSDGASMHLVRVEHEKASYYGPVPPNTTTVNVDVYDVAPKVNGIHVYADVDRVETNQQGLSVTESFFVRNESKPPRTQFGPQAFDFYLPSGAVLEGATAAGPGGMAVSDSPVPISGKNHYAFVFPVRPGETRFQIGYHLPYSGSISLQTHVSMPTDNFAIMVPKSMSISGTGFSPLSGDADQPGTQTWLATNVQPGKSLAYTVSGTGSMPREQQAQGNNQAPGAMGAQGSDQSAAASGRPGGGLGTPIDTPDPLNKYKGWILSGLGLALVIAAAFMLRAKRGQAPVPVAEVPGRRALHPALTPTPMPPASERLHAAPASGAPPEAASLRPVSTSAPAPGSHRSEIMAAIKEELFSLETERLEGKITENEYTQLRAAYEVVLRRTLARETVTR